MMFERYHFYQTIAILQSDSVKFIQYVEKLLPGYKDTKIKDIPFSTLHSSNTYDSAANLFLSFFAKTVPTTITLSRFSGRLKTSVGFNGLINFINQYTYNDTYDTTNNYRKIIGDNPDDFNDKTYGTPAINLPEIGSYHATMICGNNWCKQG